MGACERLPLDLNDVRERGEGRAPRGAAVVARERLPVERVDVLGGGFGRAPRGASVGARERLPVGREDVRGGGARREPRDAAVGARERMPVGRDTCWAAAIGGHLEVLQWARANGCPWDEKPSKMRLETTSR